MMYMLFCSISLPKPYIVPSGRCPTLISLVQFPNKGRFAVFWRVSWQFVGSAVGEALWCWIYPVQKSSSVLWFTSLWRSAATTFMSRRMRLKDIKGCHSAEMPKACKPVSFNSTRACRPLISLRHAEHILWNIETGC